MVISEPGERKKRAAIQILSTIRADKSAKRQLANEVRNKKKSKEKAREAAKFEPLLKEEKKRKFRENAQDAARRLKKAR